MDLTEAGYQLLHGAAVVARILHRANEFGVLCEKAIEGAFPVRLAVEHLFR